MAVKTMVREYDGNLIFICLLLEGTLLSFENFESLEEYLG